MFSNLDLGGSAASTLQQVTVKIIPNNSCHSKYSPANYKIVDHMVMGLN